MSKVNKAKDKNLVFTNHTVCNIMYTQNIYIKERKSMKKRILCITIAVMMITSLFSAIAFAEDTADIAAPILISTNAQVNVTFCDNNGDEPYTIQVDKGVPMHELPYPEFGENVFVGWFKNEALTNAFYVNEPVTEDITLYAKWSAPMAFADVDENTEFFSSIAYVFYNGIMNGLDETTFGPSNSLTRAMLVTILYRADGEPAFMNDLVFSDVERGSYYEKAVVWAQGKGIVNGVSETEFSPYTNITREQLAAIVYRYALYKELPVKVVADNTNISDYLDAADCSEYAIEAICGCIGTGALTDNRKAEYILPKEDATRAEAANAITVIKSFLPYVGFEDGDASVLSIAMSDLTSGRATLYATLNSDGTIAVVIRWSNSASEYVQWSMTASLDENKKLSYTDCTKKIFSVSEEGNESEKVEYENGKGYFSAGIRDEGYVLLWDGAEEENCKECVFAPDEAFSIGIFESGV